MSDLWSWTSKWQCQLRVMWTTSVPHLDLPWERLECEVLQYRRYINPFPLPLLFTVLSSPIFYVSSRTLNSPQRPSVVTFSWRASRGHKRQLCSCRVSVNNFVTIKLRRFVLKRHFPCHCHIIIFEHSAVYADGWTYIHCLMPLHSGRAAK